MLKKFGGAAVLSLMAALAGCTDNGEVLMTESPFKKVTLRTLVAGMPAADAFGSEAQFRATMEVAGESCPAGPAGPKPGECLDALRDRNSGRGPAIVKNVGGAPGKAAFGSKSAGGKILGIADLALNPNGTFKAKPDNFRVQGQIMETCEDGAAGYSFAWDNDLSHPGTLSLCVTTYMTSNIGAGNEKTTAVQMRVNVNAAARVEQKVSTTDPGYDPSNVFPDAAAATGIRIHAIQAAGFGFKLYGAGNDMTISKIWLDRNYKPANPNFVEIPSTATAFAFMFQTSPDSCIDMMFQTLPPPLLQANTGPPFYCLGRCKGYPALVNTF
ncbi:MAG: hypothetical protein QF384_09085 [Alphaproteobacteria bacterium]|jgi:hypothetical protein|nr:hypothetical protein [Alphaproteobacteria bacterium]